ncbi:hypothetical protein BU24DRAFT_418077 [Aaosphaeria arxii CBS 175.79]|uniref:Pre-mRNA-splicing factor SYF2 n=1 Tax=Aaosphaeria arxii CBS 175.79 TaxID=1450172 RepID=A0A6A5Y051_9PLEO|nr:uncharacterized protein BU24DRAFT_418077 [Aaosphaeria arxii CBS 175.79]KAF2018553.1 hypothetical protein BU24DRAFT_418077 [Aaosphaeria arxii CBS 175.79]
MADSAGSDSAAPLSELPLEKLEPNTTSPPVKSPRPHVDDLATSILSHDDTPAPAVQDQKASLAARMARFKSLRSVKIAAKKETREVGALEPKQDQVEEDQQQRKLEEKRARAQFKLEKMNDPDGRKQAFDYTAEESQQWDKRTTRKRKNREDNAFNNHEREANKTYKRQVRRMDDANRERYQLQKAEKIQEHLDKGWLQLLEDENGEKFVYDPKTGKRNEPAEEEYQPNHHKPSAEDIDRAVDDEVRRERARLEARAKRMANQDDGGDVTAINEKNKQFNNKLARFYNKFTTETRENFERGTAI